MVEMCCCCYGGFEGQSFCVEQQIVYVEDYGGRLVGEGYWVVIFEWVCLVVFSGFGVDCENRNVLEMIFGVFKL